MKKLIFILLISTCFLAKAQNNGLTLTGHTFTNTNDSVTLSMLYIIPAIYFNGVDGGYISLSPCRSKYQAMQLSPINRGSWNIPMWTIQFSSLTNISKATAIGLATPYLQEQGFIVTTW